MVMIVKRHKKSFFKNVYKIGSSVLHADKASTLRALYNWFNSKEDYELYDCGIVQPYYDAIKKKLLEKNFDIEDIIVYKVDNFFVCTYAIKAKNLYTDMEFSGQSSSGNELILFTAAIVFNISCRQHNHCGILHAR